MGLSFRKSIKIGKNTRINLSKTGGIGISTGVKGATVSANQKGIRASAGTGGIRYSKSFSFDSSKRKKVEKATIDNNRMAQNHTEEEIKELRNTHYTRHLKLIFAGIACGLADLIFLPLLLVAFILLLLGIICMLKNWKRINNEYKIRINK